MTEKTVHYRAAIERMLARRRYIEVADDTMEPRFRKGETLQAVPESERPCEIGDEVVVTSIDGKEVIGILRGRHLVPPQNPKQPPGTLFELLTSNGGEYPPEYLIADSRIASIEFIEAVIFKPLQEVLAQRAPTQ